VGRPGAGVAVAEADLDAFQRAARAARQVAGVKQGDADPRLGCGGEQGGAHRVGVVVTTAVAAVVKVVELAGARHPGQRHLGEGGPGQPVVAVRVQPRRHLVHVLPPRPEAAAAALGAAAQGAVEGVGVGVGKARNGHPRQPDRPGRRRPTVLARAGGPHLADATAVNLDAHRRRDLIAAQPRVLAEAGCHAGQWGAPDLPDCGSFRIVSRKGGIGCQ
jgi:hypothetical protein